MDFTCRGQNCQKRFSSAGNRNKHERAKEHGPDNKIIRSTNISFDEETKMFKCPTDGCITSSKYKHNIVKHLKSCCRVNMHKISNAKNKTFSRQLSWNIAS